MLPSTLLQTAIYSPRANTREITIEVSNDQRQRLLTIKVTLEVDRVHPSPEPRAIAR